MINTNLQYGNFQEINLLTIQFFKHLTIIEEPLQHYQQKNQKNYIVPNFLINKMIHQHQK